MIDYTDYKLVTHKNCMDGAVCAILYRALGGKEQNVHFSNPQHEASDAIVEELLDDGHMVLAVDVSISMKLAKKIYASDNYRSSNFQLLDHHKSAVPLMEIKQDTIEIEEHNNRCGCRMLYDFLMKEGVLYNEKLKPYVELVKLVDDHDRWIKQYPESDDIAMFYMTVGQKLFIERFLKDPTTTFSKEEEYLIKIEKYRMEEEVKDKKRAIQSAIHSRKINGKTYRFGFVTGVKYVSTTGNALYADPSLNVDVIVLVGNTISMRCSKDSEIDLSAIAKSYGGGGHKAAAGFQLKALLGKDLIDLVIENFKV